jgi:starvation-inducible DNA-binding protein
MNLALRSIGDIARHQRLEDSDSASLTPNAMLAELLSDNQALIDAKGAFAYCGASANG